MFFAAGFTIIHTVVRLEGIGIDVVRKKEEDLRPPPNLLS